MCSDIAIMVELWSNQNQKSNTQKRKCTRKKSRTLEELKIRIQQVLNAIPNNILLKVIILSLVV